MNDPVKAIQSVRHRLARLAALQTITALLPPLVVLIAVGIGLRALGQQSWERWGLVMPAETARMLQFGLLCAAAVGLVTGGVLAGLAYRRSLDPVAAAEQIDLKLGSRQEVLTLATMAGAAPGSSRSPLFPILWRRASQHLDRLDPPRMFPFEVKRPLRQGLFLTVSTVGLIAAGISVLLAANQPLLGAQSRQLRKIAREIANSNPADAQTRELAARLRAVANSLDNPKVPPQTKLEQLASVQQDLKAQEQRQHNSQAASGKGQSASRGNQGQGSGESKEASGKARQGNGSGPGKGNASSGGGDSNGQTGKGEAQLAQARKSIAQVQARLEAEAKQKSGQQQKSGLKARAPRPGEQPDLARLQAAGGSSNLNRSKSNQQPGQEPSNTERDQSGQQRRDFGSSKGDTHLGQFPQPGNFERFYKAGEHGTPLDIKNARYVLFRIPPALIGNGAGKSVADNDRPSATVPYANLPLKDERIDADPDERQLVPPRYRDLLR